MTADSRPAIPQNIKRAVRQECGFGCIICGMPIYEYDHIIPYAEVNTHEVENLCLLCPNHHSEKTRGLLPKEIVLRHRLNPRNKAEKYSHAHSLKFDGEDCRILIGGYCADNKLSLVGNKFAAIVIEDCELLSFKLEDGQLLLTLILLDENGKPLVGIDDNELVYRSDLWDVEFVGKRLTIRHRLGVIGAELIFDVPRCFAITRGTFWSHSGASNIEIYGDTIEFAHGNKFIRGYSANVPFGVVYRSREDFAPSMIAVDLYM